MGNKLRGMVSLLGWPIAGTSWIIACGSIPPHEHPDGGPGGATAAGGGANGGAGRGVGGAQAASSGRGGSSRGGGSGYGGRAAPVVSLSCTSDIECCVVLDDCVASQWLVNASDQAKVVQYLASLPRDICAACIPPIVQVACQNQQCVGTVLASGSSFSGALVASHCGPLTGLGGIAGSGGRLSKGGSRGGEGGASAGQAGGSPGKNPPAVATVRSALTTAASDASTPVTFSCGSPPGTSKAGGQAPTSDD